MDAPLLQVNQLRVGIAKAGQYAPVVDGVSFTLQRGETLVLLGESGCGKSLTATAIMHVLPAAAKILDGQVLFQQQDLNQLPEVRMRPLRGRRMAMIFQDPMTSLNPVLTVGEQIGEVLTTHLALRQKAAHTRILDLLAAVGMPDPQRHITQYPHQLSGGMKQRVMIAMAIACEPELLIADEPTSALDVTIQAQILALLQELQQRSGMAMLLITHDLGVAKKVTSQAADQVAVMYAGHLVEQTTAAAFFKQPLHPYSQQLFASLPAITKRQRPLSTIAGQVPPLGQGFTGCRFAARCPKALELCKTIKPRYIAEPEQHFVRCHLYDPHYHLEMPVGSTCISPGTPASTQAPSNSDFILQVKDAHIHFPVRKGILQRTVAWVKAVDGVSFQLKRGKTLALVGESGCGKTTLAQGLLQLLPKTAGEIAFNGTRLHMLRGKKLRDFRQRAQLIFQDPFSAMNPRMLVGDIIAEGMQALGVVQNRAKQQAIVADLLDKVGLPPEASQRYPHEFSGGQRQRICIARALAVKPTLIVCDEPTSALDVSVQAQILNLLKQLQCEQNLSYLFITHNMSVVAYLADEIAVMHAGKIVEMGTVHAILENPQHPYTRKLLDAVVGV